MNGDPYGRGSQPADRRVINRSGAAPRPTEEPQQIREEAPVSTPRSSGGARRNDRDESRRGSNKGLLWTIIVALAVIAIGAVGWLVWSNAKSGATGIDSSRYQAVFLEDGRVVFGKLTPFNEESFKLTNVYALGATEEAEGESSTEASNKLQLVPTVSNVHGPEDAMIIMKAKVLYFQNLRTDSEAARLIQTNSK